MQKQTDEDLLTVLFWNVWVANQLTPKRLDALRKRLDTLIKQHKPQVIGLNEVLADVKNGPPAILRYLEEQGYHTHFEPFSPESNGRFLGSAVASRAPLLQVNSHSLGPDNSARRRGQPGHVIKAIHAQLMHNNKPINIVVNHLAHLVPHNIKTHAIHLQALKKLIAMPHLKGNTIIGGDFNQFKFMPWIWGALDTHYRRTGNLLKPTWKLGGFMPIIQANYDNIFWPKTADLRLQAFQVLPRGPSDHTPLLAQFDTHHQQ